MKNFNRDIESYARAITKMADSFPVGGWYDETQAGIVLQQLKSTAGSARQSKCDNICPKCIGKSCKHCKNTGFMPKRIYEMAGGK